MWEVLHQNNAQTYTTFIKLKCSFCFELLKGQNFMTQYLKISEFSGTL